MMVEPEDTKALVPTREPEVITVRIPEVPASHESASLKSRLLPALQAALSFAGREIVPRVLPYVLDALDRRDAAAQAGAAAITSQRSTVSAAGSPVARLMRRHRRRHGPK